MTTFETVAVKKQGSEGGVRRIRKEGKLVLSKVVAGKGLLDFSLLNFFVPVQGILHQGHAHRGIFFFCTTEGVKPLQKIF